MSRMHLILLFIFALTISAHAAGTYYVGSCHLGSFATINAAISAVPAGSIVNVCPGDYPEQVVINKALTLQGMPVFGGGLFAPSGRAAVRVPDAGLNIWASIVPGPILLAPQVLVTAASVNISDITVDGTAPNSNCPSVGEFFAGIFYSSGSSGVVNEVVTRNQNCNGAGVGVWAENGPGLKQSVTIQNSNINTSDNLGILVCSTQTPSTLAATIKGNYVSSSQNGIETYCNASGTVSGNIVSGTPYAILVVSASATITGNTVNDASIGLYVDATATVSGNTLNNAASGIYVLAPATITSNKIFNSKSLGIFLAHNGATVTNNTLVRTAIGIDFQCHTATATGNTINGATTGLNQPLRFPGVNTYFNVDTLITGGC